MKKLIINCETKEEEYVDMTAEEVSEKEALEEAATDPFDTSVQDKALEDKINELIDKKLEGKAENQIFTNVRRDHGHRNL